MTAATFWPLLEPHTHIGALADDMLDLTPLQDTPTSEDVHYWTHGDDKEDKDTAMDQRWLT